MVMDLTMASDCQKRGLPYQELKPEWQAIVPEQDASDTIQKKLFYGRTILVPGNRVFVISGSIAKNSTENLTDEVQEWDLETMIVKKVAPIPVARTSAAAYLYDRYIYMLGGNLA